jgi:hypothetical protein
LTSSLFGALHFFELLSETFKDNLGLVFVSAHIAGLGFRIAGEVRQDY